MTTSRMSDQTLADIRRLEQVRGQIEVIENTQLKHLREREEVLKWQILEAPEVGTQVAIARVYKVSRQAVKQWVERRQAAAK